MQFSHLAIIFNQLEQTSSRLELIRILSDLFISTPSPDEIQKVCYIVQGRIAPFFEKQELGMADKTIALASSIACNMSKEEVLKLFGKYGDVGETLFHLIGEKKKTTENLTLDKVFSTLTIISHTSGEGTIEKKTAFVVSLLQEMDALSAKYLVRILLGSLRLGIGDPTILEALSQAKFGERTYRKVLEGAYNRTSDLGLLAKVLWEKGIEGVEKLDIQLGHPIRSQLCERLPTPQKVIEKMGKVNCQYKYDGFRVQIHKNGNNIRMFSRNLEDMTDMFPELIIAAQKQIKAQTAIIDCEALAYNPDSEEFLPFQETTKRRRKYNIDEMAKTLPLRAFVFDILYKNGTSLLPTPLEKRLAILETTLTQGETLLAAKNYMITKPEELAQILEDSITKGLEGIVVKKIDSLYEAGGRNFSWVKLKRHANGELNDTIDCVILGYILGKGKRVSFGAGALLVGVYDAENDQFVSVSRIGTGLRDEEWKEIHARADKIKVAHKPSRVSSLIIPSVWINPEIVIEILADEITRSPIHTAGKKEGEPGYALRFPRLVSFRDADKKAEDATTVKELIAMYKQQSSNKR